MAVIYDEGRRETLTRDGVEVVRTLRVTPYSERGYVADLLLGGCRLIGGFLFRIPPSRDPWLPWCICQSVSIEGTGTYTGTAPSGLNNAIVRASYNDGARLVVTYRTPEAGQSTLDPRDGDLEEPPPVPPVPTGQGHEPTVQQEIDMASETYDFGYQYLTHDGAKMGLAPFFSANPVKMIANQNGLVTKRVSKIEMTLVRHYVIRVPFETVSKLTGTVNANAFRRGRTNWPAETLRFDGLQSARRVTSFGVKFFDITLKFGILSHYDLLSSGGKGFVGWQRYYDWDTGQWWYAVLADDPTKMLYEYDIDNASQTINGSTVEGFSLLFHPRAT